MRVPKPLFFLDAIGSCVCSRARGERAPRRAGKTQSGVARCSRARAEPGLPLRPARARAPDMPEPASWSKACALVGCACAPHLGSAQCTRCCWPVFWGWGEGPAAGARRGAGAWRHHCHRPTAATGCWETSLQRVHIAPGVTHLFHPPQEMASCALAVGRTREVP
jgi:hypothetical protein